MRKSEPQSVNRLINHDVLFSIQEKGKQLTALNHLMQSFLPKPLGQQCCVANYRQGILVIHVSSASWLTRLRYEHEKLRSQLRYHGLSGLSSIQFKINPELNPHSYQLHSPAEPHNRRHLSAQSAELLFALAEQCSPRLKNNLLRLAQHGVTIDNS